MAYSDHAQALRLARAAGRKITVIGGGTGLSTLLLGLKEYSDNITAIVTVSDDGGGSGALRREFGILPPGDIRNCILALANTSETLEKLLNYRFSGGSLAGQNLGNLFLLALNEIYGSFDLAVAGMQRILAVTGRVLPVTGQNIALRAIFEDGTSVVGETAITRAKKACGLSIERIELSPVKVSPLPAVLPAITEADVVVLGPGSLYTSLIPNLLVEGVADALAGTQALRIYVLNLMTQEGETEGYSAFQHVSALLDHAGGRPIVDTCVYNTRLVPQSLLAQYAQEGSAPVYPSPQEFESLGITLSGYDMLTRGGRMARHDPLRLAYGIMDTCRRLAPRPRELGRYDSLILGDNLLAQEV